MSLAAFHDKYSDVVDSVFENGNGGISLVFKPTATLEQRAAAHAALGAFDFTPPAAVHKDKADKEMLSDLATFSPVIRLTIDSIIALPAAQRQAAFVEWCGGISAPRRTKIKAALAAAGVIVE